MAAIPQIIAFLLLSGSAPGFPAPDTLISEVQRFGSFHHATRVETNPQGWIYVIDEEQNQVVLLKSPGSEAVSVGGLGWTSTTFDKPTGLATDGLNVYVADNGNHRLQRFDAHLNFISSFSTRDTSFADARFGYPLGIALSRLGDLFLLDGENLRLVKFRGDTQFERAFGDIDDRRSRLRRPEKVLLGSNDHVYVLETDRLLEFDYFGHFLRSIGEGIIEHGQGFCLVRGGFLIATPAALLWFDERGALTRTLPASTLETSGTPEPIQDVGMLGDRLLLLTSTAIHLLDVKFDAH